MSFQTCTSQKDLGSSCVLCGSRCVRCPPRPHLMAIFLLLILASEAPLKILRRSKRNLGLLYRSHHLLEQPKMLLNCLTPPAPANLLKEGGWIGTHLDIGVAVQGLLCPVTVALSLGPVVLTLLFWGSLEVLQRIFLFMFSKRELHPENV